MVRKKNILNNTKNIIAGDSYKHYKDYETFDNIYIMTIKCIIWGILGLILGICIDNSVIYLSNKLKIKYKILQNIIQITICAVIVAFLHSYHNFIGWTLQNTIPGIFFITSLFNVQFKILDNIQSTYIIKNDDK